MKLPGLRPLAAIGGRDGEISYGAQNGCIYARMESNLISPSHSFSLGQSHYRSNSSPGWQMFYYADESAAEMVPLRHCCHHGNIYLLCSDHLLRQFSVLSVRSSVRGSRGRQRAKNVIKPSLPPLVYCALPRGASEMLRHDEGMPVRAGGRARCDPRENCRHRRYHPGDVCVCAHVRRARREGDGEREGKRGDITACSLVQFHPRPHHLHAAEFPPPDLPPSLYALPRNS